VSWFEAWRQQAIAERPDAWKANFISDKTYTDMKLAVYGLEATLHDFYCTYGTDPDIDRKIAMRHAPTKTSNGGLSDAAGSTTPTTPARFQPTRPNVVARTPGSLIGTPLSKTVLSTELRRSSRIRRKMVDTIASGNTGLEDMEPLVWAPEDDEPLASPTVRRGRGAPEPDMLASSPRRSPRLLERSRATDPLATHTNDTAHNTVHGPGTPRMGTVGRRPHPYTRTKFLSQNAIEGAFGMIRGHARSGSVSAMQFRKEHATLLAGQMSRDAMMSTNYGPVSPDTSRKRAQKVSGDSITKRARTVATV